MMKQLKGAGLLTVVLLFAFVASSIGQTTLQRAIGWARTGKLVFSDVAPTVSSGFGTSAAVVSSNGATSFTVSGGTTAWQTGVIAMPTASTGWNCYVTNPIAGNITKQTSSTTTTVTVYNYTALSASGTGNAAPYTTLQFVCAAY